MPAVAVDGDVINGAAQDSRAKVVPTFCTTGGSPPKSYDTPPGSVTGEGVRRLIPGRRQPGYGLTVLPELAGVAVVVE